MSRNLSWLVALSAVSCASRAHVEDQAVLPAAATSSVAATAEPVAEVVPEPTAAPAAEPPADPAADGKKAPPRPSGRPAILIGPQKKIESTFGSTPASVLKLKAPSGEITLKLNEYTLRTGVNVLFEVGARVGKGKAPVLGELVHVRTQVGDSTKFSEVEAYLAPFVVTLPSKKSVNLAIGTIELDEAGQELSKVKSWRVVAPTRFDAGLSQVVFELDRLGPSVMHATTAEATVTPAPAP